MYNYISKLQYQYFQALARILCKYNDDDDDNDNDNNNSFLQSLCRVAAVKSLLVHHHSAGYILFPLGSLSLSWLLKIEYRLSRCWGVGRLGGAYAASQTTVLHIKRLNQTEFPIFLILYVLCFQRQSFFNFIYICCLPYCTGHTPFS